MRDNTQSLNRLKLDIQLGQVWSVTSHMKTRVKMVFVALIVIGLVRTKPLGAGLGRIQADLRTSELNSELPKVC